MVILTVLALRLLSTRGAVMLCDKKRAYLSNPWGKCIGWRCRAAGARPRARPGTRALGSEMAKE